MPTQISTQISTQTKTVLITSDCPLLTRAISALLPPELSIIKESNTTFLNQLDKADVVLLCYITELSPHLYARLLHSLKEKQLIILTNPKIVPISIINDVAFISLRESEEQVSEALQNIINNKIQYSQQAAHEIIKNYISPHYDHNYDHTKKLTKRETQVYKLLPKLTNKQIAEKLNISPITVRTHINNIKKKLGCDITRT